MAAATNRTGATTPRDARLCLAVSLWITLPMSVLAAGFLVRIFIIQHDCGHGSFFKSRWANELIGSLCSLMTLTPYDFWRRQHARHHGSWNNLDRRAASGLDIYSSCMTVSEYRALGRWRRCLVRLSNHPIVANLLLPPLVFVILYRVPFDAAKGWRRERRGVYLTNLALAVFIGGLGISVGYARVAAFQSSVSGCSRSSTALSMRSGCRTQAGVLPRPRSAALPTFACRAYSSGLPAISAFTTCTM
jgi:acyl-lipid omega-6 desaturase (Delta-12 desaturase)